MPKIPQSRYVALLFDADNALNQIAQILRFSASYGPITICHAYGDWKKPPLSSKHKEILAFKIKPVQQDRIGRNATDQRLIAEADKILASDASDTFIIVSGDGHFKPLCKRIKESGKDVIGIGNKNHSSQAFQRVCTEFIYIEDLENELKKLNTSTTVLPRPVDLKELEKLLDKAFLQLPQKDGCIHYAPLGKKLRELEPNFESRFGGKKLSIWLKSLAQRFESREQLVRRINR